MRVIHLTFLLSLGLLLLGHASIAFGQAPTLDRSAQAAENMEPAIPRTELDRAVAEKLAALEKRSGKKPNILWLVVDDMGYGDPGCYGGGAAS